MTPKAHISVTFAPDGKTPIRHLVYDGIVIGELSLVELIELLIQAPSTIRWERTRSFPTP